MNSLLYQFFEKDHRRLDALLDKATEIPGEIQMQYYNEFRTGLLTHIKMEEKVFRQRKKQTEVSLFRLLNSFVLIMEL